MSVEIIETNQLPNNLREVSIIDGLNEEKRRLYNVKVLELKKYKDSLLDLDLNLKEYMHATKNNNEVIDDLDFCEKVEDISNDSLIIYVKKAQLYKVYNPDGLDDFTQDAGTHYRRPEFGPAYEVVRDSHPQKLMIVVQNDIENNSLDSIKKHILEFIKKKPTHSRMTPSDLTVYNCDNNTEIVISSLKFDNIHEKELFIESFIIFMQEKGESEIANKIQIRHPPSSVPGTRFYQLPCSKTLVDDKTLDLVEQLLTTTGSKPSVVINNTYIIQNNVGNTSNVINNINNVTASNDVKTLKSFYKHLYDTKPTWYIENEFVPFGDIESAYREFFNDYTTKVMSLSRSLNKKLFIKSTRINQITKKKLVSYKVLKTLF